MIGYTYGNSRLLNSTTITQLMFKHQGNGFGLGIWVDWDDQDWAYKGYFGNGPGYTLFMFFKNGVGVVCFANQGAFSEDFALDFEQLGEIVNYNLYVMNEALKLLIAPPPPEDTFYAFTSTILAFSLFSGILVFIRRRK